MLGRQHQDMPAMFLSHPYGGVSNAPGTKYRQLQPAKHPGTHVSYLMYAQLLLLTHTTVYWRPPKHVYCIDYLCFVSFTPSLTGRPGSSRRQGLALCLTSHHTSSNSSLVIGSAMHGMSPYQQYSMDVCAGTKHHAAAVCLTATNYCSLCQMSTVT